MTTITIDVSPHGEIRLATHGYAGTACRDASRSLELALGLVTSDRPTWERYATAPAACRQRQGFGGGAS
ncbi:MAG: DUF2997 domain-containing protein [Pirellulales bacterium]|nr:DUF2997 domain-containing protein [Pirellulales bacterium]